MFVMASNQIAGKGCARGRGYGKWLEEERQRRAGEIAADEVVEGKVSRGTQTDESEIAKKERQLAAVRPNSHLRDGGAPAGIGIARGQYHPQQ